MSADTVTLRFTVPREAFERMKAKAAGEPLAPIFAAAAMAWLDEPGTGATSSTDAPAPLDTSNETMAAVYAWMGASGLIYPTDRPQKKSALVAWATEQGFTPGANR